MSSFRWLSCRLRFACQDSIAIRDGCLLPASSSSFIINE